MNHSRTDLIEMDASTKDNPPNIPSKEKRPIVDHKRFCITVSVITILLIWIGVLVPLVVTMIRFAQTDEGTGRFLTQNLSAILPPINSTNSSNLTIIRIDCIDNFIYVPGEEICYPECQWSPYGALGTQIIQILLLVLGVLGIVLGSATLIGWLLTSCVDWKKLRLHYDFQLARTSLFMVVLSSFIVILTNACADFIDRSVLFCKQTETGENYLLPHLSNIISNDPNIRLVSNSFPLSERDFEEDYLCSLVSAFSVSDLTCYHLLYHSR